MTKRFIIRKNMVDILDAATMKNFIHKVLDHIEDCQANRNHNPNLEKLGHDVLKTVFEFGLVNLDGGCSGCGGSCHTENPSPEEPKPQNNNGNGKVIPFKKLH